MTTFSYAAGSAREVDAGLLVTPVFEGPEPGPGVRELRLLDAYAAARHTGKKGEHLLVTKRRGDRFAADAVLLVGVGPKDEFDANAMRRTLGRVAGTGRRFGTVATTFAQAAGSRQAAEAVQACVEGLGLGGYRFDRYRSEPDERVDLEGHGRGIGPLGREGDEGRREARRHDRRGGVLGARPGEHTGR